MYFTVLGGFPNSRDRKHIRLSNNAYCDGRDYSARMSTMFGVRCNDLKICVSGKVVLHRHERFCPSDRLPTHQHGFSIISTKEEDSCSLLITIV